MSDLRPELVEALRRRQPFTRLDTLAGDASTRRFHRIHLAEGATRVVMDYGRPFAGETDDMAIARLFASAGLPVARVVDVLPGAGCLILEDLGDLSLEQALAASSPEPGLDRPSLYARAVDLAARVATRGTEALARSERAAGPALDEERFRFEMDFFVENFLERYRRRTALPDGLRGELAWLAGEAASHPRVLCHRDYHSRNLMVLQGGALAMVDIQDARWGPDTYDIASLLRDAYVDIGEDETARLLAIYRRRLPDPPPEEAFLERFHITSTQRMIKALGTFGYQVAVLGRRRYESSIPRTLRRLWQLLPTRPSTEKLGGIWRELGADVAPTRG